MFHASGGRHHNLLAPDLMVSEEKDRAASGWLLDIRNLSSGGCTAEKMSRVLRAWESLRGLWIMAWFPGYWPCVHLDTGRVGFLPAQRSGPRDTDTWATFSGVCGLHRLFMWSCYLGKVQSAPLITQNTEDVALQFVTKNLWLKCLASLSLIFTLPRIALGC